MAHRILVPQRWMELVPSAVEAQYLIYWTAREIPDLYIYIF